MVKIKTFKFVASKNVYSYSSNMCECHTPHEIDDKINDFISKTVNELIDIKITAYESRYHNNGGYNNVELIYTIIYK